MKGYTVVYKNKKAKVEECYIVNVLIDEEELSTMRGSDFIIVKTEDKTMQVKRKNFFLSKIEALKEAKEFEIKQDVKEKHEKVCYWCGKKLERDWDTTLEHIKPQSKCSTWYQAWNRSNLVLSCFKCNHNKGKLNAKINLHIQRKAELIKYKQAKFKCNKISCSISHKQNNAMHIVKRDSRFYNVKAFFLDSKYVEMI